MKSYFTPEEIGLLSAVRLFAKSKNKKLYLVGGLLRDLLLSRRQKNLDFDFCLRKGAINFAGNLARELKSGFVVLDREHGSVRIVKKFKDKITTLDFTDFRGKDLAEDILYRDFTVNTLALELNPENIAALAENKFSGRLIDFYQAKKDLKSKTIRMVDKSAFDADPLRILRAFSLSAALGFKIAKDTLNLAKIKKRKLKHVSGERIRDEVFKILGVPDASRYICALDDFGILKLIFPEIEPMRRMYQGPYHHLDVLRHSLEALRQLELALKSFRRNKEIRGYLDEFISAGRRRSSLIKLAALLHDLGKPKTIRRQDGKTKFHGHERVGRDMSVEIARRLRLSNDERQVLARMVFWHLRPGYLADNAEPTERAKFRYFRDAGGEAVSILLLSLADQRSTRGRLTTKKSRDDHERVVAGLLREYFKKKKEKKLVRLINGDDLIKSFKLTPSPLIGKILREIEELQAIGKIKNRKEALFAAKSVVEGPSCGKMKTEKGR